MKLNIPFVTQQNNRHRNDCGAACIAMLTGATIDDVLMVANQTQNKPLHMQDLLAVLSAYKIPREHVRPLSLPQLREFLTQGYPVIALVNYGRLPERLQADDYNGNHYVVVTGFRNGSFLVHDPLWPDERGQWVEWPELVLGEAMLRPYDAMPLQEIVVQRPYVIVEPTMGELGRVVSEALRGIIKPR